MRLDKNFKHLLVMLLGLSVTVFSEVKIEATNVASAAGMGISLKNSTTQNWAFGGWRFMTNSIKGLTAIEGNAYAVCINTPKNGQYEHTTQFKSTSSAWAIKFAMGATNSYTYGWGSADTTRAVTDEYLLLKTGSAGTPDMPDDEDPITIDQIDSLLLLSSFYDENFRYKDSLGANGGIYAGGFLDTWRGQTQIQLAINKKHFTLSNTDLYFDPDISGGPMYWMTLAMGQEYFNVDMQWMLGFGAKETFAGVAPDWYNGTNADGAYGCFEVESVTGLDRALAFPSFYPEYPTISTAADVTTSGVDAATFAADYTDVGGSTPLNSSAVVGSYVLAINNQFGIYSTLSYADDFCWKETMDGAKDPYVGLGAIAPLYNLGITGIANIASPLLAANYQNTKNDPMARNLFPEGNSNYRSNILTAIQTLIDASTEAQTDPSILIWDYSIPWSDVQRFFFGDGGTVAAQGKSGLLKHFIVSDVVKRQVVYDLIKAAFDKLKGKAPSTKDTETISYRYDWLTIMRVVKQYFDNSPLYAKPGGGDLLMQVGKNSGIGGCAGVGVAKDTTYPYGDIVYKDYPSDFIIDVHTTDNTGIKEVKWTIDSTWSSWQFATFKSGSGVDQTFTITVPKAQIDANFGQQSGRLWFMVTDESGNSIFKETTIAGEPSPALGDAIIMDASGNGIGDSITIFMTESSNDTADQLSEYSELKISWPTNNSLKNVSSGVTVNSNSISIKDNSLSGGDGEGLVTFKYPSKTDAYSAKILDRVGPAIVDKTAKYYQKETTDNSSEDTLFLTVSEPINSSLSDNIAYLSLKSGSNAVVDVKSKKAVNISGNNWAFIFNNRVVNAYDSVMLVVESGLVDAVGNKPVSYNQLVPIGKLGSKDPVWQLGYIKDTDGDGIGDKIVLTIRLGTASDAYKASDADSTKYSWPNKGQFKTIVKNAVVSTNTTISITNDIDSSGVGEGNAEIYFTGLLQPVTGSIIDSIGPAVKSAEYKEGENSDPTTLTVVFTEPIENISDIAKKYLHISTKSLTQTAIAKQGADGTVWIFTVDSGSVVDGDSINIISTGGIVANDGIKNKPLSNNKYIPITVISNTIKLKSVQYYDTNADGIMDKVALTFKKLVDINSDISFMNFKIEWLDKDGKKVVMNTKGTDFIATSDFSTVEWSVTPNYSLKKDLTSLSGTDYGAVTVIQKIDNSIDIDTTVFTANLIDKMAPVIISAEYTSYNSNTKKDFLKLVLSESIQLINSNGHHVIFSDGSEYKIELSGGDPQGTALFFDVVNLTDSKLPKNGDLVKLNSNSNTKDLLSNSQNNPDNKSVVLKVYRAVSIKNICYIDNSTPKDGRIDIVRVKTDTTVSSSLFSYLDTAIILPNSRLFDTLESSDFTVTDSGFDIAVSQDLPFTDAGWSGVYTGIDTSDYFVINSDCKTDDGSIMIANKVTIIDSLAPVIKYAALKPAYVDSNNYLSTPKDTLIITFSESVNNISGSGKPFEFIKPDGSMYSLNISNNNNSSGDVMIFTIQDKNESPTSDDSVYIFASGNVSDVNSVEQVVNSYPIPLTVGKTIYTFRRVVFPNPLRRGDSDEKIKIKKEALKAYGITKKIDNKSIAIMISPYRSVADKDAVEASITIFDLVGNVIVDDARFEYSASNNKQVWYFLWNGENSSGRLVGSGTYVAQLRLKIGEDENVHKIIIGIGN